MSVPTSQVISLWRVCCAGLVIAAEAYCAYILRIGVGQQLVMSGIRAFVQLSVLGGILYPIFEADNPFLVMGYIFGFMIIVSAWETSARPKVTYPRIFNVAVVSLGGALFLMGSVLMLIVAPDPWYNAQYLIPLAGMLINNSLSSTALALNQMIDHLMTRKEHLEVLLAFGATRWEASWPGFVKTCHAALIPTINGMNVIGIVSIPGMMTGQILGGAPPMEAARYQIIITFLISGCSFMAVSAICLLTIRAFFDQDGRLDTRCAMEQSRLKVSQLFDPSSWRAARKPKPAAGAAAALLSSVSAEAPAASPLELRLHRRLTARSADASDSSTPLLEVDLQGRIGFERPITVGMSLKAQEVACIMGPSGVGKSTILKFVCNLLAPDAGHRRLRGVEMSSLGPQKWRRDVLYVQQNKAPLPGTPKDLIKNIQELRVNRGRPELQVLPLAEAVGLHPAMLDRPWSELSGGEAQRMMISIAMSTKPDVLLLDEPTSALDEASKEQLEAELRTLACGVLCVTHDEKQAERMADTVWRVEEQ